jgi:hypothetical protein
MFSGAKRFFWTWTEISSHFISCTTSGY